MPSVSEDVINWNSQTVWSEEETEESVIVLGEVKENIIENTFASSCGLHYGGRDRL